jgi:hypothetical protein
LTARRAIKTSAGGGPGRGALPVPHSSEVVKAPQGGRPVGQIDQVAVGGSALFAIPDDQSRIASVGSDVRDCHHLVPTSLAKPS